MVAANMVAASVCTQVGHTQDPQGTKELASPNARLAVHMLPKHWKHIYPRVEHTR